MDAGHLVLDALQMFLPPARVDVADWASEHRWVQGARTGRWDHAVAPYLTEPMRTLTSTAHDTVALVGPGQCGKTAIAENFLLASVDQDPASILWYMQTDDSLKAYVKDRINPMIEAHEGVRSKQGLRAVDDSLGYKRFRGMSTQFLVAARSNLINKSAPRIIADEVDAYDPSFGNPIVQLNLRRAAYGSAGSMLLAMSHPDLARGLDPSGWTGGVMALYADSDRRRWWWDCPECGCTSSPNPGAARFCALVYPDDAPLDVIAAEARLLCPCCGALIEDRARRAMNLTGRWIGQGQEIDQDGVVTGALVPRAVAGFWIVGVMSPFLLHGIGGLARARVEAERAREQSGAAGDTSLREVVVKHWGFPFDPPRRVGAMDATALADRAEPGLSLGEIPAGVRFLTAFADVQANRFDIMVRGWGERGESWIVAVLAQKAEPATSAEDWDTLLAWSQAVAYPLAGDPARAMRLRAFGYDSGGMPGVTQQAYDSWKRWHGRRKIRLNGHFGGRPAWSIIPTKGLPGVNSQRLAVVRPDTARRDRQVRAAGEVPLAQFSANTFKDDLAGQLARADPGPWAVHIPAALRAEAPPHPWFEMLVAEERRPNGAWVKLAANARNEALDQMVGNHVLAHLNGLNRIDWGHPPSWAADWDRNPLVGPVTSLDAPPEAAATGPGARPETARPAQGVAGAGVGAGFNPAVRRSLGSRLA